MTEDYLDKAYPHRHIEKDFEQEVKNIILNSNVTTDRTGQVTKIMNVFTHYKIGLKKSIIDVREEEKMKLRNGFVSNSSSSSFVLVKEGLTQEQIDIINDAVENINEQSWSEGGYMHNSKLCVHGEIDYLASPIMENALTRAKISPTKYEFN